MLTQLWLRLLDTLRCKAALPMLVALKNSVGSTVHPVFQGLLRVRKMQAGCVIFDANFSCEGMLPA